MDDADKTRLDQLTERVRQWKERAVALEEERDRERARADAFEQRIEEWKKKFADLSGKRDRLEQRLAALDEKKDDLVARLESVRPAFKHFDRVIDFADAVAERFTGRRFDLCFTHDALALEAARTIVERNDCPLVVDVVEHPDLAGLGRSDGPAIRACRRSQLLQLRLDDMLSQADLILAVSSCLGGEIRERNGKDSVAIRNCRRFSPVERDPTIRADCGLNDGDKLVLYPNDISQAAFLDVALGALALMPGNVHMVQMGNLFADVEAAIGPLVERHGVQDRFHRVPPMAPDKFIRYRTGADAALTFLDPAIPNHRIALPNRVFEAVASRLPLAVPNFECIGGIVNEYGFGIAFTENTSRAVADALMRLLADPSYRDNVEAAAQTLTWENEQTRLAEAIKPLLDKPAMEILFLANKRIATNDRCSRMVAALLDLGHRVTFVALDSPHQSLRDSRALYEVVLARPDEGEKAETQAPK